MNPQLTYLFNLVFFNNSQQAQVRNDQQLLKLVNEMINKLELEITANYHIKMNPLIVSKQHGI